MQCLETGCAYGKSCAPLSLALSRLSSHLLKFPPGCAQLLQLSHKGGIVRIQPRLEVVPGGNIQGHDLGDGVSGRRRRKRMRRKRRRSRIMRRIRSRSRRRRRTGGGRRGGCGCRGGGGEEEEDAEKRRGGGGGSIKPEEEEEGEEERRTCLNREKKDCWFTTAPCVASCRAKSIMRKMKQMRFLAWTGESNLRIELCLSLPLFLVPLVLSHEISLALLLRSLLLALVV